jgi:hypothetical protein
MPRFHFRLTNGTRSNLDRDGVELVDEQAAMQEAEQMIEYLLREAFETRFDWNGWEVQVLDLAYRQLAAVPFPSVERDGKWVAIFS